MSDATGPLPQLDLSDGQPTPADDRAIRDHDDLAEDHFAPPPPDSGQVRAVAPARTDTLSVIHDLEALTDEVNEMPADPVRPDPGGPVRHDPAAIPTDVDPLRPLREIDSRLGNLEDAAARLEAALGSLGDHDATVERLETAIGSLRERDRPAGVDPELVDSISAALTRVLRTELSNAIVALAKELTEFVRVEVRGAGQRVEDALAGAVDAIGAEGDGGAVEPGAELGDVVRGAVAAVLAERADADVAARRDAEERLVREVAELLDKGDPHEQTLGELARNTAALAVAGAADRFDMSTVVAELRAQHVEIRSRLEVLVDRTASAPASAPTGIDVPLDDDEVPADLAGRLDAIAAAISGRDKEIRRLRAGLAELETHLTKSLEAIKVRLDRLALS